jgi:uncharacterized protein (DUF1810 family)
LEGRPNRRRDADGGAGSAGRRARRRSIVGRRHAAFSERAAIDDPFNLQRFEDAQAPVVAQAMAELRAGRKQSHWMWFVFPQLRGLGSSPMARRYAIASLEEARAFLDHPVLGPRLRECTQLVIDVPRTPVGEIFGAPDDLKFRSSMTLFARAAADDRVFTAALRKYFDGVADAATEARL